MLALLADSVDNKEVSQNFSQPLSMSGNDSANIGIASVFITHTNGKLLTKLLGEEDAKVVIRLQEIQKSSTGVQIFARFYLIYTYLQLTH